MIEELEESCVCACVYVRGGEEEEEEEEESGREQKEVVKGQQLLVWSG